MDPLTGQNGKLSAKIKSTLALKNDSTSSVSPLRLYGFPLSPLSKGSQAQPLVMVRIQVSVKMVKSMGSCYKSYYYLWTDPERSSQGSGHLHPTLSKQHLFQQEHLLPIKRRCAQNRTAPAVSLSSFFILLEALFPSTLPKVVHCADHTLKRTWGFSKPFLNWKIMLCLCCPLNRLKEKPLSRAPRIPTLVKGWCYLQSNGATGGTLWVGS